MNLARAALAYATRLGWSVFPQHGKRPAIRGGHGYLDATTDPTQIARWWREYPNANIGVSCVASGILAVDIDDGQDWPQGLRCFIRQYTGGGGTHLLYRARPEGVPRTRLSTGAEVKWLGSITVAPSVHPETGNVYVWADDGHPLTYGLTLAPAWLYAQPRQAYPVLSEVSAAYEAAAVRHACEAIATALPGTQERTLHCEAYSIGRLCGHVRFADHLVSAGRLMVCSRGPWTVPMLRRKVLRSMAAGAARPRVRAA